MVISLTTIERWQPSWAVCLTVNNNKSLVMPESDFPEAKLNTAFYSEDMNMLLKHDTYGGDGPMSLFLFCLFLNCLAFKDFCYFSYNDQDMRF